MNKENTEKIILSTLSQNCTSALFKFLSFIMAHNLWRIFMYKNFVLLIEHLHEMLIIVKNCRIILYILTKFSSEL